jgi:ribonuclease J
MRVRIHRGAQEIGGSCVEIESSGDRLVLDIGTPLDSRTDEPPTPPSVPGLKDGDDSIVGLLISHPHQDHYGLVGQVHGDVPIFTGQAASAILSAAQFFSPASADLSLAGHLSDRRRIDLGGFRVTPYLVDHSAFDSYSVLVEADDRRLFYTGDLRAHGRKSSVFERLLTDGPEGVNAMLLEGTRIARAEDASEELDESAVEREMVDLFAGTEGLALVYASAQNIDRLVTVYRASKRAGRTLVMDLYGATIAQATGRETIPQPGFPRLRVYVPQRQRVLVKEAGEFNRVDGLGAARIFTDEMRERPQDFVALLPGSATRELARAGCLDRAGAIWSLWPGYLERPSAQRLTALLDRHDVPLTRLHASGHATVEQLQRLVDALQPDRVVPIHTSAPELYPRHFPNVEPHADGQWWEV